MASLCDGSRSGRNGVGGIFSACRRRDRRYPSPRYLDHSHLRSFPILIEIEGTTEFTLEIKGGDGLYYGRFIEIPASGAGVVGHGRSNQVAALAFGAAIGTKDQFEAGTQTLAFDSECRFCTPANVTWPFNGITNRFLGLKFQVNGQVHYGWVGFSKVIAAYGGVEAWLTAYAYETEPNTPISAGQSSDSPSESQEIRGDGEASNAARLQPATLGVLALGSLGLNAWRKQETVEEHPL
jgi:hypothetical protein